MKRSPRKPSARPTPAAPTVSRLSFRVTHPEKVFFPNDGYTKGDLLQYYTAVAPQLLPIIRDRPLALKRYPGGVGKPFFFQHNAPERVPRGVRVESVHVETDDAAHDRLVGGALATLLYTVQLGCIGVDPWHARIDSLASPDYAVIDLDPGAQVSFSRIVQVALWVKTVLDAAGLRGSAKTSGSRGIHVYIPLPRATSATDALAVAQHVAGAVAQQHPAEATIIRELRQRGAERVYVDYLQNSRGKTVAAAYGVRAVDGARVSMPLRWSELTASLDPHDFTIRTAPARIAKIGDVWGEGMAKRNTASAIRELLR